MMLLIRILCAIGAISWSAVAVHAQTDPMPSWNDGPAKQSIIGFVAAVTTEGAPGFRPVADRIATFDQDGTTWVSHPFYGQALFALHRVATLAPQHPEWKTTEPYKTVLSGDHAALAKLS